MGVGDGAGQSSGRRTGACSALIQLLAEGSLGVNVRALRLATLRGTPCFQSSLQTNSFMRTSLLGAA